jgi:hypothetical protein
MKGTLMFSTNTPEGGSQRSTFMSRHAGFSVVVSVRESAINATLADLTSDVGYGDPGQLKDLTRTHGVGAVYAQTITEYTNPGSAPILVPHGFSAGADVMSQPRGTQVPDPLQHAFSSCYSTPIQDKVSKKMIG